MVLELLDLVMSEMEDRRRFWGLVLVQMLLISVAVAIVWGLEMSDEKRAEGYMSGAIGRVGRIDVGRWFGCKLGTSRIIEKRHAQERDLEMEYKMQFDCQP